MYFTDASPMTLYGTASGSSEFKNTILRISRLRNDSTDSQTENAVMYAWRAAVANLFDIVDR